ncbi:uncharacterized protein LOC131427608 [Malaya genurostris]|uniref:uncharacterized protein LOC131427608 n=1 Tax=Malaya genurostris TaxID=325434 RepID=UPI0026F3D561|nr:uncharacterized protein LOC131427608 [Malaya genurostris]
MIRSKRLHSASTPVQQQTPSLLTCQFLSYTAENDIQFVAMEPPSNSLEPSSFVPSSLTYSGLMSESFPAYGGPFQVIEPGSDLYLEIDSAFCFDSSGADQLPLHQQSDNFSENGIPQQVLDDVFRMEDEMEADGELLPSQYPVADNLSMADYEMQLVAEMNKLFPEVSTTPVGATNSRLMEELIKYGSSDSPCYMNVQLKSDGIRSGRNVPKLDILKRDKERGFRCVDMVDGNGKMFKAKYYEHITIQKQPKLFSPVPVTKPTTNPMPYRRITELLRSNQLANVSPSVANKIEKLANNNRNVTLTPIRGSTSTGRHSMSTPAKNSTTIVIKAPKRTIAHNADAEPTPPSEHFPMPIIKQEPPDDPPVELELQQQLSVIDSTPIEVPTITPMSTNNTVSKQPRKQKLQSLSQCDVIFNDSASTRTVPRLTSSCNEGRSGRIEGSLKIPPPRVRTPNDFVTVTIKGEFGTNIVSVSEIIETVVERNYRS